MERGFHERMLFCAAFCREASRHVYAPHLTLAGFGSHCMTKNLRTRIVLVGVVLLAIGGWRLFGFATSLDEAIFLWRLSSKVSSAAVDIKLSELMPGDWELVCESHGYDGPLYLARYNKTFNPVAPAQDAVWGLIFISKDGSFTSAVASCRTSGVSLGTNGCTERESALLIRERNSADCLVFSTKPANPAVQGTLRDKAAQRP